MRHNYVLICVYVYRTCADSEISSGRILTTKNSGQCFSPHFLDNLPRGGTSVYCIGNYDFQGFQSYQMRSELGPKI